MEVGEKGVFLHCHTRMIPALRWAAMRAILMFNCEGQSHKTITFEERRKPKIVRTEIPLLPA